MNKIKRVPILLFSADILCFILLLAIQLKLTDGFKMPDQADYLSLLITTRNSLFVAFIVFIVITIAFCMLTKEIHYEISFLHERIRQLEKTSEKKL